MSISLPTTVALAILFLLAVYKLVVYPLFLSPLSAITLAHPTSFCSPLWILYIRYSNTENATLLRCHKAKGPIIRLGPNELSVNCVEDGVKTIYGTNFDKPDWYPRRFGNYGTTSMFTLQDAKQHAARKRMLSNVYSKSNIMSSPGVQTATRTVIFDRLLPILQSSSETGQAVDIFSLSYAYSIDSFMCYQFGSNLGSNLMQNKERREWYFYSFFFRRPYFFWTAELPEVAQFILKFGLRLVPTQFSKGSKEIEDWNLEMCDEAEKILNGEPQELDIGNQPAIFSAMKTAMDKSRIVDKEIGELYPSRLQIASEMLDHNAAGFETSGAVATYLFYELSLQPELQARLRTELLTLSPSLLYDKASGSQSLPDAKALDALPLLDAVLQETLRLYASVPGPQPRLTPYPSCCLAGIDGIPGGIRVSASAWCLHRNETVFPEPEKWLPERWMNADEEKLKDMRRWFWAFGSGGRMCIGSHFAINSMKHAIAAAYMNFESKVLDAGDMRQTDGFTNGPRSDKVMVSFHRLN